MYLKQLIFSKKTIFNIDDLRQIWQIQNKDYLKTVVSRLFKRGEILRIKRGIYTLSADYNIFELSDKINWIKKNLKEELLNYVDFNLESSY